jgi:Pentapeptide repeats (9 copies)
VSAYLDRKDRASLTSGMVDADDTLFANQRFDGNALSGVRFTQCTFANVSFKDVTLRDCHFSGCVFESCYFRRTTIRETHFPASRFIDCEFSKPVISDSGFGYSRFERSVVPYQSLNGSLPGQPNVCRDLTASLAIEAEALGRDRDAHDYRLKSIEMREHALWRGFTWADEYSAQHYPTDLQRFAALARFSLSRASGAVWGYGESIGRLLFNLVVVAGLVWPLLLLLARGHLHRPGGVSVWDCWALSLASVLNSSSTAGTSATGVALVLVLVETAIGVVLFGLFVVYVFRSITRRG